MDGTDPDNLLYEHTQRAWWTVVAGVAGLIAQVVAAVRGVRAGRQRAWSYLPGALSLAFGTFVAAALTVVVRRGELEASCAAGLFRRRIDLARVLSAEVVTVPWYYGRGLRFTPRGWLYSVWGCYGVRLELADGSPITIGSDEPYLLLSAVEQARRHASA